MLLVVGGGGGGEGRFCRVSRGGYVCLVSEKKYSGNLRIFRFSGLSNLIVRLINSCGINVE